MEDLKVKISVAGTGRMGAAMAQRLMSVGHEVSVWNRSKDKTKPLVDAGATLRDTPRELASACELVITILTDAAAVDATYGGESGLLSGEVKGKLFVEMSTVRPEIEEKLAQKVRAKGAAIVDCPVGGTVGPALDGKLLGFVGGEPADVARAKPVLDQLCRRVEHVGPVGSGARMKLAINLPLLVYWQALGEALLLIKSLGLDPARVMDILADTSGGPNVLKARGPAIVQALKGEDVAPVTFDVDSIRKDLRTMLEEGRALGADLPVTACALACFDDASRDGLGGEDASTLPARFVGKA
jgi:3-hydroxyisobutyrate dehydrogenase